MEFAMRFLMSNLDSDVEGTLAEKFHRTHGKFWSATLDAALTAFQQSAPAATPLHGINPVTFTPVNEKHPRLVLLRFHCAVGRNQP